MLTKRQKNTDANVCLNSAIFQGLLVKGIANNFQKALEFAKNCNYALDNSRLYGVENSVAKSVFELFLSNDKLLTTETSIATRLLDVLLKTNAHHGLNGKSVYELVFQPRMVIRSIIKWLLDHSDVFGMDSFPSPINVLTLLRITNAFDAEDYNVKRLYKVIGLILQYPDPYTILNRLEIFQGVSEPTNALRNAITFGSFLYVKSLLQFIPYVDLDVFGSNWQSAEYWFMLFKQDYSTLIKALLHTAREILEEYRTARALYVTSSNMFPLVVCQVINEYGARPQINWQK